MDFVMETLVKKERELELLIKGEGHTLLSLLRKELFNDPAVIHAGYMIKHPLIKEVRLFLETNGDKPPEKALEDAARRLEGKLDEIKIKFENVMAEN